MNLRLKIEILAAGLVGIGLIYGYFTWQHKQREIGAARVEAADAKAVAAEKERQAEQLQREQDATNDAINALQAERERLEARLSATPISVRLCPSPASSSGRLPTASSSTGSISTPASAGGTVSGVPEGTVAGPDIGPQLRDLALVCELGSAQIRAILARERGLH